LHYLSRNSSKLSKTKWSGISFLEGPYSQNNWTANKYNFDRKKVGAAY
jgi:hypothetical protein